MNQFLKIASFFLVIVFSCNAQHKKPADFIPKGYVKFEHYFGDVNKYGQEDCVLIIKKVDKHNIVVNRFDKEVDRNRRGIIILFKKKNGYQLADKNYDCFSSENEDGGIYFPPQLWIEFQRGNLLVHYGHGRYGHWRYTFRYQEASFKLIGYDASSNRGPVTLSETSINFLTKKKLTRENTNQDAEDGAEVFKETWKNIKIKKLIKLSEIKDFDDLEMYEY